jgi:hypothetical protein
MQQSEEHYIDHLGVPHLVYGSNQAIVFRRVMKFHMDSCYAAGLDATQAANLLVNGAGYLIGARFSEQPEERENLKEQLVVVLRRKIDQAVEEGRKDRASQNK